MTGYKRSDGIALAVNRMPLFAISYVLQKEWLKCLRISHHTRLHYLRKQYKAYGLSDIPLDVQNITNVVLDLVSKTVIAIQDIRRTMKGEDMGIATFAKQIPCAVSTLELDLPRNDDIEADGPFDRPDEYYLNRQRKAYGPSESPIDEDE